MQVTHILSAFSCFILKYKRNKIQIFAKIMARRKKVNITKNLLRTAAMLTGFILCETPVQAETEAGGQAPTLKIGGYTVMNAYAANQQRRENGKGGPQPHFDNAVSDLYFTITGKTANGFEYKYRINHEAFAGGQINQNYVEFNGNFGTVQLGNVVGPEDRMIYDASRVIGGTGGFDGAMFNVINKSAGVILGNDNVGDTGYATKVAYYSPEVMGFQLGFAYTPHTTRKGDDKLDNASLGGQDSNGNNKGIYPDKKRAPYGLRNMAVGLTYNVASGLWHLTLSGAAVKEKSYIFDTSNRSAVRSDLTYQLGTIVGYDKWQFALGWLDNQRSRLPIGPGNSNLSSSDIRRQLGDAYQGDSGHAWNMGASYTLGAYQFAGAYQRTDHKTDAKNGAGSDIYSATVDFAALQGLKVYGEVDYVRMNTNDKVLATSKAITTSSSLKNADKQINKNSGTVFIVGTKLSF